VRNKQKLDQTRLITIAVHLFYIIFRILIFRSNLTRGSLIRYILFSFPALFIQFWFEKIGRPVYGSEPGDLRKSGEDLDAQGLTEWMWDVLYWTYGCILFAAVIGDRAWWLYVRNIIRDIFLALLTVTLGDCSYLLSVPCIHNLHWSATRHGWTSRTWRSRRRRNNTKQETVKA
jgi:hypothetical protein